MNSTTERPTADRKHVPAKAAGSPGGSKPKGPSAKEIAWNRIPWFLRDVLEATPDSVLPKVRLIRGTHKETIELVRKLSVLEHLLDVAPGLCVTRVQRGDITTDQPGNAFRKIREVIVKLEEAMRAVGTMAQLPIRAWNQQPDHYHKRKSRGATPQKGPSQKGPSPKAAVAEAKVE